MTAIQSIAEYLTEIRRISGEDAASWLNKSEVLSSAEINDSNDEYEIELPVNKVAGKLADSQEYLKSHHLPLREDAISPLRNAVSEDRKEPHIMEQDSQEDAAIYEKAHIIGFKLAINGLVVRISFSLRRVGKRVLWELSKRLLPGSIVALTPAKDMFKSVCRIATVAARPLSNIQLNTPKINLFWARPDEIEMNPLEEWVMVESRAGNFEAYRHTLRSPQKMAFERFPLSGYLVNTEPEIQPPLYLEQQPKSFRIHISFKANGSQQSDKPSGVEGFSLRQWSIQISLLNHEGEEAPATIFEKATYKLHPSFDKRATQVIKRPPFRIDEEGWGESDMEIILAAIDKGGDHTIGHDLNFQAERYEAKHTLTFKNLKPNLLSTLKESGPTFGEENGVKPKCESESAKKKKRRPDKRIDMEKLADNLQRLGLGRSITGCQYRYFTRMRQPIHTRKMMSSKGEFHVDLYTLPDNLVRMLWEFSQEKIGPA